MVSCEKLAWRLAGDGQPATGNTFFPMLLAWLTSIWGRIISVEQIGSAEISASVAIHTKLGQS